MAIWTCRQRLWDIYKVNKHHSILFVWIFYLFYWVFKARVSVQFTHTSREIQRVWIRKLSYDLEWFCTVSNWDLVPLKLNWKKRTFLQRTKNMPPTWRVWLTERLSRYFSFSPFLVLSFHFSKENSYRIPMTESPHKNIAIKFLCVFSPQKQSIEEHILTEIAKRS